MPTAAPKSAPQKKLGRFEGRDVIACRIILTRAGDGLSASVEVDPVVLHVGDHGYLLMEYDTAKIRHEPTKDNADLLLRVQILEAGAATFVDDEFAEKAITEQKLKIKAWRDEQEGTMSLDLDDGPTDPDDAEWEKSGRTE